MCDTRVAALEADLRREVADEVNRYFDKLEELHTATKRMTEVAEVETGEYFRATMAPVTKSTSN